MNFLQNIGLLVTGGALTVIGGIVSTLMTNSHEKKKMEQLREEAIADRNFTLKKDAFCAALEEFNFGGLAQANQIGNRVLSEVEARSRNRAMTLFDIFAPESVREKAAKVLYLLSRPNEKQSEHQLYIGKLVEAQKELTKEIKRDLGID